jgi:hypothetical protein
MILKVLFKDKREPLNIEMSEKEAEQIMNVYSQSSFQSDIKFSPFEIHKKSSIAGLKLSKGSIEEKEFSNQELREFEKWLESLKSRELKKPLSYYTRHGVFIERTGEVATGIIGWVHWSLMDYLEEKGVIGWKGRLYGWSAHPSIWKLEKKLSALRELKDKTEYAKKMELGELDNEMVGDMTKQELFNVLDKKI